MFELKKKKKKRKRKKAVSTLALGSCLVAGERKLTWHLVTQVTTMFSLRKFFAADLASVQNILEEFQATSFSGELRFFIDAIIFLLLFAY